MAFVAVDLSPAISIYALVPPQAKITRRKQGLDREETHTSLESSNLIPRSLWLVAGSHHRGNGITGLTSHLVSLALALLPIVHAKK